MVHLQKAAAACLRVYSQTFYCWAIGHVLYLHPPVAYHCPGPYSSWGTSDVNINYPDPWKEASPVSSDKVTSKIQSTAGKKSGPSHAVNKKM